MGTLIMSTVKYNYRINTTDAPLKDYLVLNINGSDSYIRINHQNQYKFFETNDYSVLWVLPTSQSDDTGNYNSLVSKGVVVEIMVKMD